MEVILYRLIADGNNTLQNLSNLYTDNHSYNILIEKDNQVKKKSESIKTNTYPPFSNTMIQRWGTLRLGVNSIRITPKSVFGKRSIHVNISLSQKKSLKDSINKEMPTPGHNHSHMNTAAINFTPNITYKDLLLKSQNDNNEQLSSKEHNLIDLAMRLRCTDDMTEEVPLATTTQSKKVEMASNLPFNVKMVDKTFTKKLTKQELIQQNGLSMPILKKYYIEPYLQLTKPRLTILVMLSAICSYALSPTAASISQLLSLTVGTTLCSGAANAINMGREPEFDRQMTRTQARPVVRGLITPNEAYSFATVIGTLGVATLYFGVNPTVAWLGFLNIPLYSWIYTSLKRKHIINTWVGAIVGAIPPLMGWAAASSLTDPAAWVLAGLLYAWQFPHFNALSHSVRTQYKNAGYVMTAWKNPTLNARVCLRYSLLMFPLCFALVYYNITDPYYIIDSSLANLWLSYWCFKFYWQQRYNYSKGVINDKTKFNNGMKLANMFARKTMLASVLQLPAVFILAILHKKGRWDWIFNKDQLALKP